MIAEGCENTQRTVRSYWLIAFGLFHILLSASSLVLVFIDAFQEGLTAFTYLALSSAMAFFISGILATHSGFDPIRNQEGIIVSICFGIIGLILTLLSINTKSFRLITSGLNESLFAIGFIILLLLESSINLFLCFGCCSNFCCCWLWRSFYPPENRIKISYKNFNNNALPTLIEKHQLPVYKQLKNEEETACDTLSSR